MNALEQAVIDAARAWLKQWKSELPEGHSQVITPASTLRPIQDAVEALDIAESLEQPTNEPTGFVRSKPWTAVPVGWFVQAKPGGDWYEVLATRAMHSDLQLVKLRIGNGEVETQRPREDWVSCRAGSLSNPIGDAVQALGEGVEILEDRP